MKQDYINTYKEIVHDMEEERDVSDELVELLGAQNVLRIMAEKGRDESDELREFLEAQNEVDIVTKEEQDKSDELREFLEVQNIVHIVTEEQDESDEIKELLETQNRSSGAKEDTITRGINKPCVGNMTEIFYDVAIEIMERYKICRLTKDDTDTIWRYNGRCYQPVSEKHLKTLIYSTFSENFKREFNNIKRVLNEIYVYVILEVSANEKYNKNFTEADFMKVQNRVVFLNTVYDVLEDKCYPFSEELPYWLQVNAEYDHIPGGKSEAFERLKSNATGGDIETMDMIDRVTGLLFLNRRVKHFFVAGNASNSGKSVYLEFLDNMMPRGRVMHWEPSDLERPFSLTDIETTALISCADIQTTEVSSKVVSTLKRLTGDLYVRYDKKHRDAGEARVFSKIILGTNGGFNLSKPDAGITNRLVVLPFINSVAPEDQDDELLSKLLADRDMIVSECVRKIGEVIRYDGTLIFPESELARETKMAWLKNEDFAEEFFRDNLLITGAKEDAWTTEKFYSLYVQYFDVASETMTNTKCRRLSQKELQAKLEVYSKGKAGKKRGLTDENGNKCNNPVYRIRGIKLKLQEDSNTFFEVV